MGQSLATLDDDELGPVGSDADDDDAEGGRGRGGSLSADMVARANFGGFVRADDAEVSSPALPRAHPLPASEPCAKRHPRLRVVLTRARTTTGGR